jgi:DNA-directed RNA polymerase II subunit RPB2
MSDKEDTLNDENVWLAIKSFFDCHGFIAHQISSYNKFIDDIRNIVEQNKRIYVQKNGEEYIVEFEEVKFLPPTHKEINEKVREIYPKECTDRDITYSSQMLVDIYFKTPLKEVVYHNHYICSIPVMVMSDLCNLFPIRFEKEKLAEREEDIDEKGGYFIVNGASKVILSQERSAFNRIYVFSPHKYQPKFDFYTEVRSLSLTGVRQTTTKVGIFKKTGNISVCIPYIDSQSIPISVVFRALGSGDEKDMLSYIFPTDAEKYSKYLIPSFEEGWECDSQDIALHYIGKKGKKFNSTIVDGKKQKKRERKKDVKIKIESLTDLSKSQQLDECREYISSTFDLTCDDKRLKQCLKMINVSKTITQKIKIFSKLIDALQEEKIYVEAISYAKHLLSVEFLPHIGVGEELFIRKRIFLGLMIRKLIMAYIKEEPLSDRDHYKNKRIATVGTLFSSLFFNAFKKFKSDIQTNIETCLSKNSPVNLLASIKPKNMTNDLINVLTSNAWGGRGGKKTPGISQKYDRLNHLAALTHARKLVTPVAEGGKVEPPRKLHSSQWQIACCADTPEGKKAGLIKNLAVSALISNGEPPDSLLEILKTPYLKIIHVTNSFNLEKLRSTRVFVNGSIIGVTKHPKYLVKNLRALRRNLSINPETSIAYNDIFSEIHISTEGGRIYRPLLVVESGDILLKGDVLKKIVEDDREISGNCWTYLLSRGYVEYIDKEEEEELILCLSPSEFYETPREERMKYTHCEFHSSFIYGVSASMIPFPNHDQAPRITYQSCMGKQGYEAEPANAPFITKGESYFLAYIQKPITITRMGDIIGFDVFPSSQNAVVAVCPWYGYGQEDSLILCEDSVERGFGFTLSRKCYEAIIKPEKKEKFEVPTPELCSNFKGNTSKLDPKTGIIKKGSIVEQGDVLVGRTVEVDRNATTIHRQPKKNISIIYECRIPGRVSQIRLGSASSHNKESSISDDWRRYPNGKGYDYVRITVIQERKPVTGDKFSALHGQKGIVGKMYRAIDMPFTEEGIVPDAIINPLAFPSRMTIALLLELIMGVLRCSGISTNNLTVDKIFDLDKEGGDPSRGKDETKKMKKGRYYKSKLSRDSTPFQKGVLKRICRNLKKLGYNQFSDRMMTNGQTGEEMESLIFMGVCCYQRLKHLVDNKIHSRDKGSTYCLTRQPKEGRNQGGGLRNGIMERDVLIGQGVAAVIRDRFMEQSDESEFWYCNKCGLQAQACLDRSDTLSIGYNEDSPKLITECMVCGTTDISLIKIPYATKLLTQEFSGMNIIPRILSRSDL